jgi:hypothetical protein
MSEEYINTEEEQQGLGVAAAVEPEASQPLDLGVASRQAHADISNEADALFLIFRDGLDMPIDGLSFIATYPSGLVCTAESTARGALSLPIPKGDSGEVKVQVRDATGKAQDVCSIDPTKCDGAVIVRSPKVKAKVQVEPHQQVVDQTQKAAATTQQVSAPEPVKSTSQVEATPRKVDSNSSWWHVNGALRKAWVWVASKHFFSSASASPLQKSAVSGGGLNSSGQPLVAVVGPESSSKDNLRLGRNNEYREAILLASKRLGLIPQALCALMDCEAGKITEKLPVLNPDGQPAKDKNGNPVFQIVREIWNAKAGNAESGAAGLTQFLASTWLAHVLLPGYYIHEKSVANGWVKQAADAKGKNRWVFVLEDGTSTTTPHSKRSDGNIKKCLAMRMDPTWSINAAADYGNANLRVLEKAGLKFTALNDMERAKLMYLMHHEGEGCGPLFVKNRLRDRKDGCGGVERLRQVFALQLGGNGAARVAELVGQTHGDVEKAYRRWLSKYIDKNFSMSSKYFVSNVMAVSELSEILEDVGGESV